MAKYFVDFEKFPPESEIENKDNQEEEYKDSYSNIDSMVEIGPVASDGNIIGFVDGPMGPMPILGYGNLGIKMWTMNTNFVISHPMVPALENIEGLESLKIISKYRARVGVGKLFDDESVKKDIVNTLNNIVYSENAEIN